MIVPIQVPHSKSNVFATITQKPDYQPINVFIFLNKKVFPIQILAILVPNNTAILTPSE